MHNFPESLLTSVKFLRHASWAIANMGRFLNFGTFYEFWEKLEAQNFIGCYREIQKKANFVIFT
jgi:hypothetical protein